MANKLRYEDCKTLIDFLIRKVEVEEGKPLAIAISDDAGNPISLTLLDGMAVRGGSFALHKAYTAAKFNKSTKLMMEHLKKQGFEISAFCDPKLSPLKGGAPIVDKDGVMVGAIGVSGWTGDEDQELADEAASILQRLWCAD